MKYFGQAISKLQQLLYSKWCPSLPWVLLPPVMSQAGHIKRKYGPFYSLVDIENGRIQQFCNKLTLLSSKLHIEGVVLNLGILHVTSQPPSPALLLGKEKQRPLFLMVLLSLKDWRSTQRISLLQIFSSKNTSTQKR